VPSHLLSPFSPSGSISMRERRVRIRLLIRRLVLLLVLFPALATIVAGKIITMRSVERAQIAINALDLPRYVTSTIFL